MATRMSLLSLFVVAILLGFAGALVDQNLPAAQPEQKDSKLKTLLKERLATLRVLAEQTTKDYQSGKGSFDRLYQAMRMVLNAKLELCELDEERLTLLKEALALAKQYETVAVQRYKAGAAPQSDVLMATASRLEAEIALERATAKETKRRER